jgi:putative ABC transport system ATP-binding protein
VASPGAGQRTALILADEPTGNLDSHTGEEIMQLLLGLNRERGLTLIIVTHDPSIAAHTQRVIRLRDGLIESEKTHETVSTAD